MKAFESLERAFEHLEEYSNATLEDIQTSSPIIESPSPFKVFKHLLIRFIILNLFYEF